MELPKEEIKIRKIGERTKEIDMRVAGRPQDKPAKLLAFMGLDNTWHFFGKDDKDLLFKNPAKDEYEIILNNKSLSSLDRKSTGLNSSHVSISYAVFCLKKQK